MWLTDNQKIGVVLTAFGIGFIILGIITLFDANLLAIGNLLFISGLILIIGLIKTLVFFSRKQKLRGSICFFFGMFLVFFKKPFLGFIIEIFGFINLFGDFFPIIVSFLTQFPIVGPILRISIVKKLLDKTMGIYQIPV
ncbi:uncharacterized protein T551_01278 [Pneumocystis jirovecii RU7]|uniref:Protein transport protein GOT1 n=1 Tax=Pneumocystis jirovecii (strain RU7) TaxID=1408657 RepID=A0A0W4ZS84_PNEJ7|nr:uncharacterized protein T551_01278 [Pneumocystis jirovecii RU7]KTW31205.1 hypothetical protein T551_01278 [Pneumocystis jirovecii RU7]